jgi:Raf kinase inhibitor-like YbhB/YbcL family protein
MANNDTHTVRAPEPPKSSTALRVTSTSFNDGGRIPMDNVFQGCGGQNVAPQLSWSGAPEGTRSYAITCFDPDAPTGSGYWHWIAFNIPASVTSLQAGDGNSDKPAGGMGGRSDYGMTSYGGPCPPKGHGDHHYIFTIYALDVDRIEGANGETSGASTVFMMRGHVLASGRITGVFGH